MKSRAVNPESMLPEPVLAPPRVGFKDAGLVALCLRASPYESDEAFRARVGAELLGKRWVVRETELEARGFLFQTARISAIDESDLMTVPDDLIGNGTPTPRLRDVQFGSGDAMPRGTVIIELEGRYRPLESVEDLPAVVGVLWQSLPAADGLRTARLIVRGLVRAGGLHYPAAITVQDLADFLSHRELRIQSE